ncbi:replication factor C subunit 4-like isoform X2 [Varroa jacobsoni]|uniref:AAA+ ATPase domain-containing protein n=2 Tax=Varroa TaxID=62624 RepID=A0A7M7JIM4_VARDE|nr:replication factor C subunit 4-like [Varroa destructor]XP_022652791.1 replication factor C subunit 4-like [Varroa destructor]XP_022707480.1 replication factor C subunit 4-like isoform X2 [Varroa jacobsoni]XP_022707481.1 replication factor C subunit 4-like isoform X2 [Varroa jacobsoni]
MSRQEKDLPWIEKYRPKTVDDVASQDEVVSVLKKCLTSGDLPHLLFYGPPGTGKTSTILALARDLFGTEFRQRVLELNASDERGISVIRDKVKTFSQMTANQGKIRYRIVILDEADSMTRDAQTALRRIMEKYTKTTRFCLICNYVTKIIPPLNSRCSKFRFKPLPTQVLIDKLDTICAIESVSFANRKSDLCFLIEVSEGDMRRALTLLQSAHRICRDSTGVTKEDIGSIAGVIPDQIVRDLYSEPVLDRLTKKVREFIREGYSGDQLLTQLLQVVIEDDAITDINKAKLLEKIAVVEYRLKDGASELIQLQDLGATIVEMTRK